MKPSELLEQKGWCQKAFARDANGKQVSSFDEEAASFCLLGVLMRVDRDYRECTIKLSKHLGTVGTDSLIAWNDARGRTKEQVIALLRKVEQ